ncbi:MAG: hypothetical protein ACXW0J_07370, partial [Nitrososphaeraceae archaeon]
VTGTSLIILSLIIIQALNSSSNSNLLSPLLSLNPFNNNKESIKNNQQNISFNSNENDNDDYYQRGSIGNNYSSSEGKQVRGEFKKHLCGSSFEKISDYIVEYSVPYPCSQPVGIAIDKNDSAWIAATWMGHLIVFDPKKNYFSKFIEIPNWKTKGIFGSMVWGMDFDKFGNLWFTDQVNNAIWRYFVSEKKFEMYKVPTRGAYPAFIEFDSEGNVWFSEIFGKKLGVLYPHLVENNTSKGISEYEFEDLVQHKITSMGPVSISNNTNNKNDIVWFSAVDYPDNGSVMNYNTSSKKFNVFELSKEAGIPISIIEDDRGKIWINDHATSIFFTFDTKTNQIKKYSTSLPSTRITSSLPYFNEYRDGKLWFNEHEGNAIGYFDPENDTMVEYHIPTRSKIWGNTSNPLQFAIDHTGSIYFTEWTENKIGILKSNSIDKIPIFMNISKNVIELNSNKEDKGEIIHISLYNNEMNNSSKTDLPKSKNDGGKVKMFVSSSISKSGQLWNITGNFSNDEFLISEISPNMPYNLTLDIKPTKNVIPGNYTLTVSARYENSITYSKIIDMIIR